MMLIYMRSLLICVRRCHSMKWMDDVGDKNIMSMNSRSERTKRVAKLWFLPLADISERELLEEHHESSFTLYV